MGKVKKINKLFITYAFALCFCGCNTGSWFIKKSAYEFYSKPIYSSASRSLIKTNGYYVETGNRFRKEILRFYSNGYVFSAKIDSNNVVLDFETDSEIKLFPPEVEHKTEFDWYRVVNDSLVIEYYANSNKQMVTWAFYQGGNINPDGTLDLKFDDSDKIIHFEFIQKDSITIFHNKAAYLKKKWYQENLHSSRR